MQTTVFLRSLKCSTSTTGLVASPGLRSSSHLNVAVTFSGRTLGVRFKSGKSTSTPKSSTSANANAALSSAGVDSGVGAKGKAQQHAPLTWPEYLGIRRTKRKWQNFSAIPCSILGLLGGASYFGSLEIDPMKPILGLDPFLFYGICTTACMGTGYLLGPTLGAFIWRRLPSIQKYEGTIDKMDKEFYERIARNRVDVTLQSPTSPIPDYYGEKIGSLHQYRKVRPAPSPLPINELTVSSRTLSDRSSSLPFPSLSPLSSFLLFPFSIQWLRDQNKYRRKVVFEESA
ncbi:hypothetical protein D9757_005055 [Collybiopsis confluens]|uniref:Presequence translocated-associated motor subunit PAM17 n=1 Tax=Collybiopsis confluens TaxID=2823264 RepID=A0A8H5MCG3_9AGAR|nr:hypothetical protein D9757_005055 [Collybiopsis confluens]